jgi:alpha-ketoglutaric semialdehyde dehydrogenase
MITGKNIIGFGISAEGMETFKAYNPAGMTELPELFYSATAAEVEKAVEKASQAYEVYRNRSGREKALFLRTIADKIEALGGSLVERAVMESGLTEARVTGERGRTVNQLRLFAALLEEGSWTEAIIETAIPDRKPLAKPDIRKMLRPIGPVVVFSASNFPLAFSTAGGDTASALAAGNPVIVKGHPAHPGTNELVGQAIINAARQTGMPDGVFSTLNDAGFKVGQSLVAHPCVKAVAFTGSFAGGRALFDLAGKRDELIPVFAEMGSVNPVVLLPGKLQESAVQLAEALAGSIILGAGQFCTNPGIIVSLKGKDTDAFIAALSGKIKAARPEPMLNSRIKTNFDAHASKAAAEQEITLLAQSEAAGAGLSGRPTVARAKGSDFINNPGLAEEIFGPYSLIVECADKEELLAVAGSFKGQLTASIMCNAADLDEYKLVIAAMEEVVGRLIFNGVPTGVEVCHAMQHGGPYPASTDSRFTSVGTDAIRRFVRPVAFQDAPEAWLPAELKNDNPLNIWRKVNGSLTKDSIGK